MSIEVEQGLAEEYISPEQLRQIVVTALQGNQVPIQSLRDIVDLMRKNETSFPQFKYLQTLRASSVRKQKESKWVLVLSTNIPKKMYLCIFKRKSI